MRCYLLVPLLSILSAQKAAAQVAPAPKVALATRVQVIGANGALFPAGAACHYLLKTAFTPTLLQAEEAEKALTTAKLSAVDPHAKNWYGKQPDPVYSSIAAHLPSRGQQFYGFYNAKHQPCLFINAFPLYKSFLSNQRWLRATVWVYDGGPAFWQAQYNLLTHRVEYFSYNGMG